MPINLIEIKGCLFNYKHFLKISSVKTCPSYFHWFNLSKQCNVKTVETQSKIFLKVMNMNL